MYLIIDIPIKVAHNNTKIMNRVKRESQSSQDSIIITSINDNNYFAKTLFNFQYKK